MASMTRLRRASPTSICLPATVTCIGLTASFRPRRSAALWFAPVTPRNPPASPSNRGRAGDLLAPPPYRGRNPQGIAVLCHRATGDIDARAPEDLDDTVVGEHFGRRFVVDENPDRSEEHTSELQSLMRISYAVFC